MYCGDLCVRRLVKAQGCDPGLITMVRERSSERGLSLFDLADCLEKGGLSVRIHKGRLRMIDHPGFLFDGRHYLLLVRREGMLPLSKSLQVCLVLDSIPCGIGMRRRRLRKKENKENKETDC